MKQQLRTVTWTALARLSLPFMIMGVSLWLLSGLVEMSLFTTLPTSIAALPFELCLLSMAFCALSLWAVARYDGLAHRHFNTEIPQQLARTSGFAAIAIAQTVGFGVFSGAAVRWRMLPHIGLARAMQLSIFVSITFICALAFLTALASLILPAPDWTALPATLAFLGLPIAAGLISFAPCCAAIRHHIQIPSLRAIRAILGWSALDLMAAALALFILIPAPELTFAVFLPVFLLALGAAMISGAPGGVGPFELTLISLLPQVPTADLICAILVFRTLYYAIPAVLAVIIVFASPRAEPTSKTPIRSQIEMTHQAAEHGILAQNAGTRHDHANGSFALWKTAQTATMLFDPMTGSRQAALSELRAQANANTRTACIYKCNPRMAHFTRRKGWHVAKIAEDCLVDLAPYDLATPARRGLRRKLRKAAKSGVTVTRTRSLPIDKMAEIDAAWQTAQGFARGATMGRFCPDYLQSQDVYLAHSNGKLIAYASFHRHADAPCLDLMRHLPDLPDGTMHLIVQVALDTARSDGKSTLNLAALPALPAWTRRTGPFSRYFDNPGLRQFKSSFAPRYAPRYAAAPSRTALVLALADIATEVHCPRPLVHCPAPHEQDEEYEIALTA